VGLNQKLRDYGVKEPQVDALADQPFTAAIKQTRTGDRKI
jgi:hypothetical protein